MGWTAVKLPGGKPAVVGLGPYREAAPATGASALVRPWRSTTTGGIWFLTFFAVDVERDGLFSLVTSMRASGSVMVNEHHSCVVVGGDSGTTLGLPPSSCSFPCSASPPPTSSSPSGSTDTRIDLDAEHAEHPAWPTALAATVSSRSPRPRSSSSTSRSTCLMKRTTVPAKAFRVRARLTDRSDILIDRGMEDLRPRPGARAMARGATADRRSTGRRRSPPQPLCSSLAHVAPSATSRARRRRGRSSGGRSRRTPAATEGAGSGP